MRDEGREKNRPRNIVPSPAALASLGLALSRVHAGEGGADGTDAGVRAKTPPASDRNSVTFLLRPFLAVFIIYSSLVARPSSLLAAEPGLAELFQMALRPPVAAYMGRVLVSVRHGDASQSAEMDVAFRPPRGYRYSIYGDDETLQSTVLLDEGSTWPPLSWRQNLALLRQNYGVRRLGRQMVAGRSAEVLQFTPQHPEVPVEQIFVDPATGAILKTHSYLPDGSWDYSAAFTRISFPAVLRPEEFAAEFPPRAPAPKGPAEPSITSIPELMASMPEARAPERLPRGFHFESATLETVNKRPLAHLRYGDGLNIVSVFESAGTLPWKVPAGAETFELAGRPAWSAVMQEQTLLGWADGPWQGLVMGAMSRETLTRLAESLMKGNPAAGPRPIPEINRRKGE